MTTSAKIGFGVLLKIEDDNSPQNMVTVGEITAINGFEITRDWIDATHSESPQGWREFIAGLKDGGEFSCELNFVPGSTGTTLLLAQFDKDTLSACEIYIPTSPAYEWTLNAGLSGFGFDAPIDDKMSNAVTFKVSGKPTLAQAS
jgi:predicted secreted protein